MGMRRNRTLNLIILVWVLSLTLSSGLTDGSQDLQVVTDFKTSETFYRGLSPNDFVSWMLLSEEVGDGYYGSVEVVGDGTFTAIFCDQDAVDFWRGVNLSRPHYVLGEGVSSLDWTFVIPYESQWFFTIFNDESDITILIDGFISTDTTGPNIRINLDHGETYIGINGVTVNVTDRFGVEWTTLYIDDELILTESSALLHYQWNTADYPDGEHTFRVVSSDSLGNENSSSVWVKTANASTSITMGFVIVGTVVVIGGVWRFRFGDSSRR